MTKSDRTLFMNKLLSLRARLTGEVLHLADEAFRSVNGESSQPSHMAELGSDAYEQEVTLQMMQSEENALTQINDAINRLAAGTFGNCENCGKSIPKRRLEAIPYTRFCVNCARVAEGGS